MSENLRVLLFEDEPVTRRMAELLLPRHGLKIVSHAETLEEGLKLADEVVKFNPHGAIVDRSMPTVKPDHTESEGSKIIKRLRNSMKEHSLGFVIVEFSTNTAEESWGIHVPGFGGDYAVPKDGKIERFKEIADLIWSPYKKAL